MLNHHNAPAAIRFLSDVAQDGKAVFSSFDWGAAEGFPYLPRVQAGRVVLRPAKWRIHKDDWVDLRCWRNEWDVPKHVCLSVGDNRLVLDLDHAAQAAQLEAEIKKLTGEGASIVVQEVVPALDEPARGSGRPLLQRLVVAGPASPKTAAEVAAIGEAFGRRRPGRLEKLSARQRLAVRQALLPEPDRG